MKKDVYEIPPVENKTPLICLAIGMAVAIIVCSTKEIENE